MKRSRAERIARRALATGILWCVVIGACARLGTSTPSIGAAGATIAGTWIDAPGSARADTVMWRLAPTGQREVVVVHDGAARTTESDRWYVTNAESDSAAGRICFVRRAGRDGASCTDFQLDSEPQGRGSRRLRLLAPWTRAGVSARVLVEDRDPRDGA